MAAGLPRNPDGSLMRGEPSHSPESVGTWVVTAKERLSDPWQRMEFSDREEAEDFAARASWILPDEFGRDVSPEG